MEGGLEEDSPQSEQVEYPGPGFLAETEYQPLVSQVPSSWLECSIYQNYTASEVS